MAELNPLLPAAVVATSADRHTDLALRAFEVNFEDDSFSSFRRNHQDVGDAAELVDDFFANLS